MKLDEAVTRRYSKEVFKNLLGGWRHANLSKEIPAQVFFSEHLFCRTAPNGCFRNMYTKVCKLCVTPYMHFLEYAREKHNSHEELT